MSGHSDPPGSDNQRQPLGVPRGRNIPRSERWPGQQTRWAMQNFYAAQGGLTANNQPDDELPDSQARLVKKLRRP